MLIPLNLSLQIRHNMLIPLKCLVHHRTLPDTESDTKFTLLDNNVCVSYLIYFYNCLNFKNSFLITDYNILKM